MLLGLALRFTVAAVTPPPAVTMIVAELLALARKVFTSVRERIEAADFAETAPYKLPPNRRNHGVPMILTEVARELALTTKDAAIGAAAAAGKALVIGTTGLDAAQQQAVDEAATRVPVCQAANFSTGVNLCLELLQTAARVLGESVKKVDLGTTSRLTAVSINERMGSCTAPKAMSRRFTMAISALAPFASRPMSRRYGAFTGRSINDAASRFCYLRLWHGCPSTAAQVDPDAQKDQPGPQEHRRMGPGCAELR